MTIPPNLINPPPPPHARPPRPVELTNEVRARAIEIDRDPVTYPLGSAWEEDIDQPDTYFNGVRYWFRVVEHTKQAATGRTGLFHAVEVWVLEPDAPHDMAVHLATGTALGVDVSDYQDGADFAEVAAAGYAFAYIKASEGATGPNSTQRLVGKHWVNAGAAGLIRGLYHFFRTTSDPLAQVAHFAAVAGSVDPGAFAAPNLPPVIDVEWQHAHPEELGGIAAADFADRVVVATRELARVSGRRPVVYTAPGFWTLLPLRPELVDLADLWEADYGPSAPPLGGWPAAELWQFTASGSVPGYPGRADVSRFRGDRAALAAWAGAGGGSTFDAETLRRLTALADGIDAGQEGLT